jgi:hypothetical protein
MRAALRLPTLSGVAGLSVRKLPRSNISVKKYRKNCAGRQILGASGGPRERSYFAICNRRDGCVRICGSGRRAETKKLCRVVWSGSVHRACHPRVNHRCQREDVCSHRSSFHDRGCFGLLFICLPMFVANVTPQTESHASYDIGVGYLVGLLYIDLVFGSEIGRQ